MNFIFTTIFILIPFIPTFMVMIKFEENCWSLMADNCSLLMPPIYMLFLGVEFLFTVSITRLFNLWQ